MKNKGNNSDPRFYNPNSATQLLARQLMESGMGKINNIGEGINSAAGTLSGAWLQDKTNKDNSQKQKDYYDTLNSLQTLNKEAGGSNDDLIAAMASSSNPFVSQDAQGLKNQIMAEQLKPQKPAEVAAGGSLIDPKTGKIIFTSPAATAGGGATGANIHEYMKATGKTFDQAWLDMYGGGAKGGYSKDPATGELIPVPGFTDIKKGNANAEQTGKNESDLTYKPKIAVDTKKAEAQADLDISDAKTAPLIQNLLNLNDKTFDMSYAGAANPVARVLPGTEKQTTAMDLMQQARLEMAAPLAKQLGVNPTDKDFQASLDRIFNANSSKDSRKQQILALQQRYTARTNGTGGNVLPKDGGGGAIDYKSKYGLQ